MSSYKNLFHVSTMFAHVILRPRDTCCSVLEVNGEFHFRTESVVGADHRNARLGEARRHLFRPHPICRCASFVPRLESSPVIPDQHGRVTLAIREIYIQLVSLGLILVQ